MQVQSPAAYESSQHLGGQDQPGLHETLLHTPHPTPKQMIHISEKAEEDFQEDTNVNQLTTQNYSIKHPPKTPPPRHVPPPHAKKAGKCNRY